MNVDVDSPVAPDASLEQYEVLYDARVTYSIGDFPRRAPFLGYVHMGSDLSAVVGKSYPVVPASSESLAQVSYPPGANHYLDLDLHAFYSGDLPDWGRSEGMVRLQVDTRAQSQHATTRRHL